MEGPSLFLAKEQLKPFCKRKILSVSGNSKMGIERLVGKEVKDIFSWGKHLVFQFDEFAFRVHFLLWGTFAATVDNVSVTGDYKRKSRIPRLAMEFENGHIEMYNCSIKLFEDANLKKTYDFSVDIMSKEWNADKALKSVKAYPEEEIADVLLDQEIFSGVGNIIKNEVLFITKVNPKTRIKEIDDEKLSQIIYETWLFSQNFYKWRKKFELKKHFQIYRKKVCLVCGTTVIREKSGKRQRWSFYCPQCQNYLN